VVDSPIFQQLEVVRAGRFATFNDEEAFAIAYGSVLTIPTARDLLTRALSL
jgi:hypothetical protein